VLLARNGSRVLRGPAPGGKRNDAAQTKAKIEKLLEYVVRNRPFDGAARPVEIDLRDAEDMRVVPYTARLP
jgi:hypothetical protein